MIEGFACAKVNLSLRIGTRRDDGLHSLRGLFQSILWLDRLELKDSDTDMVRSRRGTEVVDGWDNLAWQAVTLVRDRAQTSTPVSLMLEKRIPIEAGLGGGSADAAAGLAIAGSRFRVGGDDLASLAPTLGSDVPFCFAGGTADVGGIGEQITRRPGPDGYALGIVVPPVTVSTAAAYRRWDGLDGPGGLPVEGPDVPPALRSAGPLVNDLAPAAISLAPLIEEWRAELTDRWARSVLMTGSGPTLFAFFGDLEEAAEAVRVIPAGARAATAALPAPFGWAARTEGGPFFTRVGPLDEVWAGRIEYLLAQDPVSAHEAPTIENPSD